MRENIYLVIRVDKKMKLYKSYPQTLLEVASWKMLEANKNLT